MTPASYEHPHHIRRHIIKHSVILQPDADEKFQGQVKVQIAADKQDRPRAKIIIIFISMPPEILLKPGDRRETPPQFALEGKREFISQIEACLHHG